MVRAAKALSSAHIVETANKEKAEFEKKLAACESQIVKL